jgi:tetratricopeptide (TPR) repeat protein
MWALVSCAHRTPQVEPETHVAPAASRSGILNGSDPVAPTASAAALRYYLRARMYALDGDSQAAIDAFRLAISHDPDSPMLHVELARLLQAQRHLDAARRELLLAVELDPRTIAAYYYLGEIAYIRYDFEAAAEAFARVLALDPTQPQATRALGGVLFITEGIEATIAFLVERLDLDPSQLDIRATLVRLLLLNHESERMQTQLSTMLRMDPQGSAVLDEVTDWYVNARRPEDGLALVDALRTELGDWPVLLLSQADLLLALDRDEQADQVLTLLRRTASLSADQAMHVGLMYIECKRFEKAQQWFGERVAEGAATESLYWLGYAQMKAGKCPAAIQTFARLQPVDDLVYVQARIATAQCLIARKKTKQADKLVDELLKTRKDDLATLHHVADYYYETQRPQRAMALLADAAKAAPDDNELAYLAAAYALMAGQSDACITTLQTLLTRDPYYTDALNLLAYTLASHGEDLSRAEQLARQAMSLRPADGAIIDTLGFVYLRRGETETALKWLKLAAALLPNEPEVLLHLALALFALKRNAELEAVLTHAAGLMIDSTRILAEFDRSFPTLWPRLLHEARSREGSRP